MIQLRIPLPMALRFVFINIRSMSLLATIALLNAHPNLGFDSQLYTENKTSSLNNDGNFTIEWNIDIGNQESLLETPYLKAGFEQSVKDFLNLKFICNPMERNVSVALRSLSIRKFITTTGKKQIISGFGRCIGNRDACKVNLRATDSNLRKTSAIKMTPHNKNQCEDFEQITLFDLFDDIFVDGLFFNYKVNVEGEKQALKDSMQLGFNVSYIETKYESLEAVEKVDLSFKSLKEAISDCSDPQCTAQIDVVLELFHHFGDELDESLHECEHQKILCHENNLVKYIRISK